MLSFIHLELWKLIEIYMQISTKEIGNLVRVSGVLRGPAGFKFTGMYCIVFLQISVEFSPWRDIFQNWTSLCQGVSWSSYCAMSVDQTMVENVRALKWKRSYQNA